MIEIYLLNQNNTIKDKVLYNEETNQYYSKNFVWTELDCDYTTVKPPNFVKQLRNGTEWVEGATEEEIVEWKEQQNVTPILSTEEILLNYVADLDYRLSLKEMGL